MLNKVTLIGHIGTEPEIRSFPNGKRVINFTLCTTERWRDRVTNIEKQKIEWHRIAIFNDKLIENLNDRMKKGAMLMIEGQLETRKYVDAKNQERTTTDIVLRPFKGSAQVLEDTGPPVIKPPAEFAENQVAF